MPLTTIPRSIRLCSTAWAMTGLLLGTFVVGGLHTLLWLPRAFQMRRELRAAKTEAAKELGKEEDTNTSGEVLADPSAMRTAAPGGKGAERQFVRFSRLQRVLHVCMIVSFITLAMTGLTLKFSYKMGGHPLSSIRRLRDCWLHPPQRRHCHVQRFHRPSRRPLPAQKKRVRHVARTRARPRQHGSQSKGFD